MLRSVLLRLVMVIVCAMFMSVSAMADAPRQLDVPAGDLPTALQGLAKQSGVEFIYSVDQVKGIHTGGVHGEYTIEQAVAKLLEGTKLRITLRKGGAILIGAPTSDTLRGESGSQLRNQTGGENTSGASSGDHSQLVSPDLENNSRDASKTNLESDDELQELTVTGSRLRTTEAAIVSPVIVITQDDIKKMGFSTVEDVIRSLSQNYSNGNAATTMDNSQFTAGAQGQSTADLRGLGPESTLVLVDGRRRAFSSTFGDVVNLNTIPIGSIDRIEIMTDGASAVYGSDAVAGVINFILKKDYQGGETHVREEIGANGGDSESLEQSLGDSWGSGNVTFSGRFAQTDPVTSLRAGDTTSDYTSLGGDDFRSTYYGQPGVVVGLGSLPAGNNGTNGIAGKLSPANVVPFDPAAYDHDLTSNTKDYSFDINMEQNLSGWVRAYGEFSLSHNTSEADKGPAAALFETVPTTNIYNNLGTPATVSYVFGNETREGLLSPQVSVSDQEAVGGVLGFRITLPKNWTVDISGNYSRENESYNALELDPTILGERLSGSTANGHPIPANQQLNLFGNGTAQNPAALAGLLQWNIPGYYINDDYTTSTSALLTTEGPLGKLPGGEIHLAVGGEFRREELNLGSAAGEDIYVTTSPSRTVKAAFGELNVPLVGEHNRIPGVYALNLYAAGRWEQYAVLGPFDGAGLPDTQVDFTHFSPKTGVSWYPWAELKIRGTFSKSFRAPTLTDLFSATNGPYTDFPVVDPKNPGEGTIYPNTYFVGNPHLGPETANNYTTGLDWKPMGSLRGLAVSLTYSRIDFYNRITNTDEITDPAVLFSIPGVIVRNASGQITSVNYGPVNIASMRSRNLDASASYGMDTRAGQLTFGVSGTYAIRLDETDGPGLPLLTLEGTENGPERIKARSWVTWSRSEYGASVYANYSSAYINTNDYSPSGLGPQSVDHYTTFDLNAFYKLPGGFSINAGARNLTNAAYPFFNYYVPFDTHRVDLRGRVLYLEFSSKYKL
jgi:iron complex outermembrane receptor protein